jgi:hypothetical protein
MIPFNAIIVAAGVGVAILAYNNIKQTAVVTERVRVEKQATKTDAKAQKMRSTAAADPTRVLAKYCRDCGKSGAVQIVASSDGLKGRPPDPSNR